MTARADELSKSVEVDVVKALRQLTQKQKDKIVKSPYTINIEGDNLYIKGISKDCETLSLLPDYEENDVEFYQRTSLYDLNVIQLISIMNILVMVI